MNKAYLNQSLVFLDLHIVRYIFQSFKAFQFFVSLLFLLFHILDSLTL